MQSFEYYSGTTNSIQLLCQYQDKMVVNFHDKLFLSCVFLSILKGTALQLVLHTPETLPLELRGGEAGFLPVIRFLTEAQEKQQPPPLHQNKAWGEHQAVFQLFSEPNGFGL